MAEYIEVDITALENDVKSMQAKLSEINGDMTRMFSVINEVDTMWEGPANEAFVHQVNLDNERFVEITNALSEIFDSMENAKNQYRTCENEVGEIVNSINI